MTFLMIIQMTGLSGAGKTTIAGMAKERLSVLGIPLEVIDGDVYRKTLCRDLGFSREDRCENIRRLGALAHTFDTPVIISAINPFASARLALREAYGAKTVWVDCPLPVLVTRDTKGLYRKALLPEGHPDKLHNLTGMGDPYEPPLDADLVIRTDLRLPEESADELLRFIQALLL